MNQKRKNIVRVALGITLAGLIIVWLAGRQLFTLTDSPTDIFDQTKFEDFALLITTLYEGLPSIVKHFYSVDAISIKFLQVTAMHPMIYAIFLATGQLLGQVAFYVAGMGIRKAHEGSIGDLASKSHFLHQHHFLIYLMVPLSGFLGEAVMLYTGHERINLIKIIPYLFAVNYADNLRWIYINLGNLELAKAFE